MAPKAGLLLLKRSNFTLELSNEAAIWSATLQKWCLDIHGFTHRRALDLVNFVPALAYHFCLNLPAAFTQPGARLMVEPCKLNFHWTNH